MAPRRSNHQRARIELPFAAAIVLLVGIFSYVVILGRIEPVPEPGAAPAAAHPGAAVG